MTSQLSLFAREKRDRAIDQVESANQTQINRAVGLIRKAAPLFKEFTTDDLFPDTEAWKFSDPRAIGSIMRKARKLGYIVPTNRVRNSTMASCHCRPKRVWKAARP